VQEALAILVERLVNLVVGGGVWAVGRPEPVGEVAEWDQVGQRRGRLGPTGRIKQIGWVSV